MVPAAGTRIKLGFKGIAGSAGYSNVKTDKAGWRYGFVASLKDGSRVYGKVFSNSNSTASFKVPRDTEYLWLVVSGAPSEHWPVSSGRQRGKTTKKPSRLLKNNGLINLNSPARPPTHR